MTNMLAEPEPIAIKIFIVFPINTNTFLPSSNASLLGTDSLEPTSAIGALVFSSVNSLSFSLVFLSDVSSVNVYVEKIITDI